MSNIIVQKYGGSSVSDSGKLRRVAERIARTARSGHPVVAVVSAMGDTTDNLLGLASEVTAEPAPRELDLLLSSGEQISSSLLAMAVGAQGLEAVALTGRQAGIRTDGQQGDASIVDIDTQRLSEELDAGRVVIVAGFQGISARGEVTTLGRGGSDTSAVAVAAALDAERCEIYSDVDGVHSADPRVVPGARRIDEIGYDAMREFARCGARVLSRDAVDVARRSGIEIRALSTFAESSGTAVRDVAMGGGAEVTGIAGRKDLIRLLIPGVDGAADSERRIRELVRDGDIFHTHRAGGGRELFIAGENLASADELGLAVDALDDVEIARPVGCVSAVGSGIGADPPTLVRARAAIARERIPTIRQLATDDSLTFVVSAPHVDRAMRVLHNRLLPGIAA